MRTAEVEVVRYKTETIHDVSKELLLGYATYSGQGGTPELVYIEPRLHRVITEQLPQNVTWNTPNLNIDFSGFLFQPHEMKNGRVEIIAQDPFITLEEEYEPDMNRGLRAFLQELPNALMDFVSRRYPVEVEETDTYSIVRFPREAFAENVKRVEVPLL